MGLALFYLLFGKALQIANLLSLWRSISTIKSYVNKIFTLKMAGGGVKDLEEKSIGGTRTCIFRFYQVSHNKSADGRILPYG